jgi:hypothetical protein
VVEWVGVHGISVLESVEKFHPDILDIIKKELSKLKK